MDEILVCQLTAAVGGEATYDFEMTWYGPGPGPGSSSGGGRMNSNLSHINARVRGCGGVALPTVKFTSFTVASAASERPTSHTS